MMRNVCAQDLGGIGDTDYSVWPAAVDKDRPESASGLFTTISSGHGRVHVLPRNYHASFHLSYASSSLQQL